MVRRITPMVNAADGARVAGYRKIPGRVKAAVRASLRAEKRQLSKYEN
jgi:hypothetical protein